MTTTPEDPNDPQNMIVTPPPYEVEVQPEEGETYEEVATSDEHPDDDPDGTPVDPDDEELEEDHDTEPDYENGIHEELPEGAPDPGDEPVLDEDEDDEAPDGAEPTEHPGYSSGGLA